MRKNNPVGTLFLLNTMETNREGMLVLKLEEINSFKNE